MAKDPDLGEMVRRHLAAQQDRTLETPMAPFTATPERIQEKVQDAFATIMTCLQLDQRDESLQGTPKRVARMYCEEIFYGLDYQNFPACMTFPNVMKADEVVIVKDIEVKSMCEHHFMPFMGTAAVACIPDQKLLGLSKFNRVVDFFARRPQVQERLTEQIAAALQFILGTDDIAVVISAKHLCTVFRGVKDFESTTITSKLCGRFRTVPELRAEFFSLTRNHK